MHTSKRFKGLLGFVLLIFSIGSVYLLGGSLGQIYSHYRSLLGPVFWLLIPLTVLLVTNTGLVLVPSYRKKTPRLSYRFIFRFVEAGGPTAGLLGTVLVLRSGFAALHLSSGDLYVAINSILQILAVSLSSTGFGLSLAYAANTIGSVYEELQGTQKNEKETQKNLVPVVGGQVSTCG